MAQRQQWAMNANLEQTMAARVEATQEWQQRMRQAIQGLGDDYHPFDLLSGTPCDADTVRQRLTTRFAAIERIAEESDLALKARKRIAKARRVLGAMVATIAWVWQVIRMRVDSLRLPPPLQQVLIEQLIAGSYLVRVAAQAHSPTERATIGRVADRLLAQARAPDGPLAALPAARYRLSAMPGWVPPALAGPPQSLPAARSIRRSSCPQRAPRNMAAV